MIKGVIFDLDGTLYDYHANDIVAMNELCQFVKNEFGITEDLFRQIFVEAKTIVKTRLKDGGSRHSRVLHCQVALELLNKNPFIYAMKMNDIYWNAFLKNIKLYDGALKFLQNLKLNGIKTAICTDMTANIQYLKIERLGISNLIDVLVTSEETGMEKPSPVMFELALEKLNLNASETAYFGDSLVKDVEGAAYCGLIPFWFVANRNVDENLVKYTKIRSYVNIKFDL